MDTANLNDIAMQFAIGGEIQSVAPYGDGHINETYLVTADSGKYIMQRINDVVFKDVDSLMRNYSVVVAYIKKKLLAEGKFDKSLCINLLPTLDGKSFLRCESGCYRCMDFISEGITLNKVENAEMFELAGVGFGRFQRMLDGFDATLLFETIKDFHDTGKRVEQLETAVRENRAGRLESCIEVVTQFLERKHFAGVVTSALAKGEIPLRVTHNDTKLNNLIIDVEGKRPLAVIDLDTVMAGSSLYDFGDSIRFGASTAAEDEEDLSKVHFSTEYFEAYARGYLSCTKDILTQREIDMLPFSALLMTYECGTRFLADYLNGDVYFRVSKLNHNLIRAKTQLKLVTEMEEKMAISCDIVKAVTNG